ncbi:MAG: DEAD/DEAH box helicase [Nanoarchaeota archaeon]|nr:DEAD/DEAH box helicase [Nanoarchaeota archaeon]
MIFKNFTLDPFQVDAVNSVEKDNSVVVSAATGTGKTLIADYVIDKYLKEHRRIIYTAPIKALSGQKYRDFKKEYGEENIGIMTGDVVINPDAPILIMTTEIYRNMLLAKDQIIDKVKYVIFDEIHYINDIERGTIWEESIIFSPDHIRFLCLSATIPNADDFAQWIQSIKKHTVDVVKYEKRAVPLEHSVFDKYIGITKIEEVIKDRGRKPKKKKTSKRDWAPPPDHIELISQIADKLPAIVFDFSRKDCEKRALELSRKKDYLDSAGRAKVVKLANELISPEYRSLESIMRLKQALSRGIAFHHAGLLPKAKELVELLFTDGIIKVLYATETFAVGINMPAKTVVFASLEKFDGANFRYINSKEYFQLAGRAGRRGIDTVGYSIAMVDRDFTDLEKVRQISLRDDIPIQSQFKLSFNSVLNLIKNHPPEEREFILRMNFDYYLQKAKGNQVRIMASYNNKVKLLKMMGYVFGEVLTEKGEFATKIYSEEILVTEIFCSDLYSQLSETDLNILVAAVIYEPRGKDYFTMKDTDRAYNRIMRTVSERSYISKNINKLHVKRMIRLIGDFSDGCEFKDLIDLCNLDEGDIIRLIRRVIDMLRQIRHATTDYELIDKMHACMEKLYRDVVKFEF